MLMENKQLTRAAEYGTQMAMRTLAQTDYTSLAMELQQHIYNPLLKMVY